MQTAGVESRLTPTPSDDALSRRYADFATLGESLDYAANGTRGLNFHDPRGNLIRPYPFAELRSDAIAVAHRLIARGIAPGARIAMLAETGPDFAAAFFGAIYAGIWPVPLPLPTSFGGKDAYIDQLAVQLASSDPILLLYPQELETMRKPPPRRAASPRSAMRRWPASRHLRSICPRPIPTRSPICNIRAARPAFRMASPSRIAR